MEKNPKYLLFSSFEEYASPAFYKAWVSGKPQDHQQYKQKEDIYFSIRHRAQLLHFCLQHTVCSFFFVSFLFPKAPGFFYALKKGRKKIL